MRNQQWLPAGAAALAVGVAVSLAAPSAQPAVVAVASAAGAAVGGLLGRSPASKTKGISGIEGSAGQTIALLEGAVEQNRTELAILRQQIEYERKRSTEYGKTVILYDIENLLKGYNFTPQMVNSLSLRKILQAVEQTGKTGQIIVQRAYANWSDPRLSTMRWEMNELGVDPIQVFGFSREQKKNAADIQLVIDAIDLAYVRPSLDVFVIVSGDGGFAALAKKLHEYGKTVIGCAYMSAASKTLQSVCDDFVAIADPEGEPRSDKPDAPVSITRSLDGFDPRNSRLLRVIKKTSSNEPEEAIAKTKEVLDWYINDSISSADLADSGINLSVVQQSVRHVIPDFQTIQLGFAKFVEYMQYVCKGSPLCIARLHPSQVILIRRDAVTEGIEILPDLDPRDIHSAETYRSILESGIPIYKLPTSSVLTVVCRWVVTKPPEKVEIGMAIDLILADLNPTQTNADLSTDSVKLALLSLVSAGVFIREPVGVPMAEQKLTLRSEINSFTVLYSVLRTAIIQKLSATLNTVDETVLQELLPRL